MKKLTPKDFLEIILDSITEGVFTVDSKQRITTFNQAAEKITGFSASKALGRKCFEVFQADICQKKCAIKETIRTGKPIIDLPVTILNKEGNPVPISIRTALLQGKDGRVLGGVETFRDLSEIEALRKEINRTYTFEDIISKNREMQKIFAILPNLAQSESNVLIQGASGTGKELLAKAIHNLSPRRRKPFVTVNCGALPDTLLESELFGYVKGAFTDAKRNKPGRFALAEGGTVFLDEIGDISLFVQVKLLRVLQEKEYEPLGSTTPCKANVRIISATNKDLGSLIQQGRFREDLYYRLNVVKVELPPLKDRKEDIPLLVEHFLQKFNFKMRKKVENVSRECMGILLQYDYPGNIRELENALEHAFVLCQGKIIYPEHLPVELRNALKQGITMGENAVIKPLKQGEAQVILETLQKYHGHRQKTAAKLGIDKTTLWRKMKKYNIRY